MTHRDDPMVYEIEIEDRKSKKTTRAQVGCWWSGDASIRSYGRMCDCQLAGYHNAQPSNSFTIAQNNFLKTGKCDHQPSRRFKAVRAHLPSGEVIDIAA